MYTILKTVAGTVLIVKGTALHKKLGFCSHRVYILFWETDKEDIKLIRCLESIIS